MPAAAQYSNGARGEVVPVEKGMPSAQANLVEVEIARTYETLREDFICFGRKWGLDLGESEDLVQDVFCNLWRLRGNITDLSSQRMYGHKRDVSGVERLARVVFRRALKEYLHEKGSRQTRPFSAYDGPEERRGIALKVVMADDINSQPFDQVYHGEREQAVCDVVREIFRRVNRRQAALFNGVYLKGWSYRRTGHRLGIKSAHCARELAFQAKKTLRRYLKGSNLEARALELCSDESMPERQCFIA